MVEKPRDSRLLSEISFLEVLIGFILVWIIATIWITFFKNLFYRTMGFNENSTFQTFMIALVITTVMLLFVYISGRRTIGDTEKDLGQEE